MKRANVFLSAALSLTLLAPVYAAADDAAVVVNKGNAVDSLSMVQLRKILLAQDSQWPGGKKITIYLASPGHPVRSSVLKTVCSMTETDFNLHYMHAAFNGETTEPPKVAASAAQARTAVAAAPGGLAIIRASDVDASVKVVKINGLAPGQPGYPLTIK
jgi:ABC-type phosphate transport system substrate-binding protein